MEQVKDLFDYLKLMYKITKKDIFNPDTFWDRPYLVQKELWKSYKQWKSED